MPVQQPLIDFDWLTTTHVAKRLYLATGHGLQGFIHLNGDREAMVTELIRLARIGQYCEQTAISDPTRMISHAVDQAQP